MIAVVLCLAISVASATEPNVTLYAPKGYTLSWQDTFDAFNKMNWSRGLECDATDGAIIWNKKTGGKCLLNDSYAGYITDEDSYVDNGCLVLRNQKREYKGEFPKRQFQYTSGWANSINKRYFNGTHKGVYLELKAKFPSGLKVWPAIWLVTEERKWPPEIDIWEYFGHYWNGNDKMYMCYIYPKTKRQPWLKKNHDNSSVPIDSFDRDYDCEKWHVYGWQWTEEKMEWSIDGKVVRTLNRSELPKYWPNENFSLVLNNGIAVKAKGPDDTKWPNYLIIDYLSVHEEGKDNRQ